MKGEDVTELGRRGEPESKAMVNGAGLERARDGRRAGTGLQRAA
ncbi:hypothetical protein [Paenibacillus sp. FSL R7-0333]